MNKNQKQKRGLFLTSVFKRFYLERLFIYAFIITATGDTAMT